MSLRKSWVLQIDRKVYKSLRKVPRKDSERIFSILESIQNNPFSGDVKKMKKESNVWRRRAGSYRIFYEAIQKERLIYVYHIEHRSSKTYR
jgi:mRNA-degrading endonuclease RelE of RelBE toxin-antitoxin system